MLAASFRHIGYLCTVSGSWRVGVLSIVRLLVLTAVVWGAAVACANDTSMPPITPDLIQPTATTISAGGDHTCALRPNGSPVCWGSRQHGQAPWAFIDRLLSGSPSLGRYKLTAITSGGAHTCGLGLTGPGCVGVPTFISHICFVGGSTKKVFVGRGFRIRKSWKHRTAKSDSGPSAAVSVMHALSARTAKPYAGGLTLALRLRRLRASHLEPSVVAGIIHARFGLTTRLCAGAKLIGHGVKLRGRAFNFNAPPLTSINAPGAHGVKLGREKGSIRDCHL